MMRNYGDEACLRDVHLTWDGGEIRMGRGGDSGLMWDGRRLGRVRDPVK